MIYIVINDIKLNHPLDNAIFAKLYIKSSYNSNYESSLSSIDIIAGAIIEFNQTISIPIDSNANLSKNHLQFTLIVTVKSGDDILVGSATIYLSSIDTNSHVKKIPMYKSFNSNTSINIASNLESGLISCLMYYNIPNTTNVSTRTINRYKNTTDSNVNISNKIKSNKELSFLMKRRINWSNSKSDNMNRASFDYNIESLLDNEINHNPNLINTLKSNNNLKSDININKSNSNLTNKSSNLNSKPRVRSTNMKVGYINSQWPEITKTNEREKLLHRLYLAEEKRLQQKLINQKQLVDRNKSYLHKISLTNHNKQQVIQNNDLQYIITLHKQLDKREREIDSMRRKLLQIKAYSNNVKALTSTNKIIANGLTSSPYLDLYTRPNTLANKWNKDNKKVINKKTKTKKSNSNTRLKSKRLLDNKSIKSHTITLPTTTLIDSIDSNSSIDMSLDNNNISINDIQLSNRSQITPLKKSRSYDKTLQSFHNDLSDVKQQLNTLTSVIQSDIKSSNSRYNSDSSSIVNTVGDSKSTYNSSSMKSYELREKLSPDDLQTNKDVDSSYGPVYDRLNHLMKSLSTNSYIESIAIPSPVVKMDKKIDKELDVSSDESIDINRYTRSSNNVSIELKKSLDNLSNIMSRIQQQLPTSSPIK